MSVECIHCVMAQCPYCAARSECCRFAMADRDPGPREDRPGHLCLESCGACDMTCNLEPFAYGM